MRARVGSIPEGLALMDTWWKVQFSGIANYRSRASGIRVHVAGRTDHVAAVGKVDQICTRALS